MKTINYLSELSELLEFANPGLTKKNHLEFKNCFGAVAGYVNGNVFISCGRFGLAVRLPIRVLVELLNEADVTHLKYFPNGHVKKEYAVIPTRILNDRGRFRGLLDTSIRYALSHSSVRERPNLKSSQWDGNR